MTTSTPERLYRALIWHGLPATALMYLASLPEDLYFDISYFWLLVFFGVIAAVSFFTQSKQE